MTSFSDFLKKKYGSSFSSGDIRKAFAGKTFVVTGNTNSHSYGPRGSKLWIDERTDVSTNEFYGALREDGQHGNHIKFMDLALLHSSGVLMDVRRAAQKAKKISKRWDEVGKNIEKTIELSKKYKVSGANTKEDFMALIMKGIIEDPEMSGPTKRKNIIMVQECKIVDEIPY